MTVMTCMWPGALWVCVVLNPSCTCGEKEGWHQLLESWANNAMCPLEDADTRSIITTHLGADNLG